MMFWFNKRENEYGTYKSAADEIILQKYCFNVIIGKMNGMGNKDYEYLNKYNQYDNRTVRKMIFKRKEGRNRPILWIPG